MKWVCTIAVLLSACAVPEGSEKVLVFGHGGMGADDPWPMDSRWSIEECLASEAAGVEIDVHMTMDAILIAFHDEELSHGTSCEGRVNAYAWNKLRECQYHGPIVMSEDDSPIAYPLIMGLDELFSDTFLTAAPRMFTLDCKLFAVGEWSAYVNAYVMAIGSLAQRHRLHGRVNVECMDVDFLVKVEQQVRGVKTFLYATEAEAGIDTALARGFDGITIDHRLIERHQVERAQATGLLVALFGTGGDWSNRAALRLKPDMIQTDDVRGLLVLQGR